MLEAQSERWSLGESRPHPDLKGQFPALNQSISGHPLVYLDSAATALKPRAVIEAVTSVWERDCANIHRGVHRLSQRATERYESARERVRSFLGADDAREIVFVRGATEAINLVAHSYAMPRLGPGDEIVITGLEHHANIVPWQVVRDRTGATLRVVPVDDAGQVDTEALKEVLGARTKLVAIAQVSNALGTVLPIQEMITAAHEAGAVVLVDGAQAVAHRPVDVSTLGCDFYVFSGHKLYGPDGIGVLFARRSLLESMVPYQVGGDMILNVTFEHTDYNELPHRFEAGTPSISGAVGLAAAIDFVSAIGFEWIETHERRLLEACVEALGAVDGVRLIGSPAHRSGVVSFVLRDVHPHDLGTILDGEGVAIRTGHHCAQPVVERFGQVATARASFGVYNELRDIDALIGGIRKARELLGQ